MDSFEINKIAGAILFCLLVFIGINNLSHVVMHREPLEKNAYVVEGVEEDSTATAAVEEVEEGPSLAVLLASASIEKGEKAFKKCASCHVAEKGGANKVGPVLYNTVGHEIAVHDSFGYSEALETHGGSWTFENLDAWLENPRKFIPGNKMAFAGVRKAEERADLIVYLNSHTDSPLPLPEIEEASEPAASEEQTEAGE